MAERPEKRQRVGEGAHDGAGNGAVAPADAAAAAAATGASAAVAGVPPQPLKPGVLAAAPPVGVATGRTDVPAGYAPAAAGGVAGPSSAAKPGSGGRVQDVGAFLGRGNGRLEFDPNAPSMAAATAGAQGAAAAGAVAGPPRTDRVVYASGSWEVAEAITRKMPKHAVPFTLLTGFLGAGKSTVLNYILRQPHGLRIAVLINELGEIDIDNQLVSATDVGEEDDVMELNNGCICCTISNSFIDAVQRILARFKDSPPDYLIVETTGVADPEPIMNAVQATELAEELYWDQVLTVVDASQFDDAHYGSETARRQVHAADTVLLSKTDLMAPEAVEEAVQRIIKMKPSARILRSQRGHVPVAALFDLGMSLRRPAPKPTPPTTSAAANGAAPSAGADAKATPATNGSSAAGSTGAHSHGPGGAHKDGDCDHDHGADGHKHGADGHKHGAHGHDHGAHGHDHGAHGHDHGHSHNGGAAAAEPTHLEREGFTSVSFSANKPFKLSTFRDKFVDTLPAGVFRSKGLLWFRHYPSRFLLQVSGKRFQMDQDMWPVGTAPSNQLVVIGRDFDRDAIVRSLEACLVEPTTDSDDDMTSDDEIGMLGDDPGMPPERMDGYGDLGDDDEDGYPYDGEGGNEDQGVRGPVNGRGGAYGPPGKPAGTGIA